MVLCGLGVPCCERGGEGRGETRERGEREDRDRGRGEVENGREREGAELGKEGTLKHRWTITHVKILGTNES